MRLALGHIDDLDSRVISFAKQLGLGSVQLHTPSNLGGGDGFWSLAELSALRERCEREGLILEGLENVPYGHWDKILRGEAGRDQQLSNYCTSIRNMGQAAIPVLGYHFMPDYVWRTELRARGRGDALVTAFDADRVHEGNALATYKLTPTTPTKVITEEEMWGNYRIFLDAVLPVAEEFGVRLALHPDDPPVGLPLGGAARLFASPEGLERAYAMSGGSPAWGLDLCLGSVSEMGGQSAVDRVIDFFGTKDRITYIHFRDVRGIGPHFEECFLGEGNYDPASVLRQLEKVGFAGFLIDDHVPAMIGDSDTWIDTSSEAYCSRGRAHAIGYLQGLMHALNLDAG